MIKRTGQIPFFLILAFSAGLHIAFISQIKWDIARQKPGERFFEVDLIHIRVADRKDQPFKKIGREQTLRNISAIATKVKNGMVGGSVADRQDDSTVKPIAKPVPTIAGESDQSFLNNTSVSSNSTFAEILDYDVTLPEAKLSEPILVIKKSRPQPMMETEGVGKNQIISGRGKIEIQLSPIVKQQVRSYRIVDSSTQTSDTYRPDQPPPRQNEMEGEVGFRKVIHKPTPPILNLEREVTITLRFTVLPNGEVDQIFPLEKADAELERIAADLLQKYRFEPLLGSNIVQEGIIRFTIRR